MSPQVPKSATPTYGHILDDECGADIPIPAQASTTPRPQLDDLDVPQAPPTASEPQTLGDRDTRNTEAARDSNPCISISSPTIDRSPMEAKNEDDHDIPIQEETPSLTPEYPSIDGEGQDVKRKAAHEVDTDLLIPKKAPSITTELHSVDREDRVVQKRETPSMPIIPGTSNQISPGTPKLEAGVATVRFESAQFTGGGHAFGNNSVVNNTLMFDGQFTEIQRDLICDYIANLTALPDININLKKHVKHVLTQSIISLPRAKAVFDDYQNKKKIGPCFKGTREALLREMADWATTSSESRMYILSGLAGIGKSTVAYTIASRAADLNLLGASFFFSRDEADRKNAEKFFTTIAYQLCVYNETFSKAIGDAMLTERGSAATTKDPQDQLQALILNPLRNIVQSRARPILVVVDALDECDEDDERGVIKGLTQLVRELPSFKVILTTRPQLHLDRFLCGQDGHKIFRLQDIEDKVVDGDIRLYFNHTLSLEAVRERYPQRQWCASGEEIDSLVHAAGRLFIIASTAVWYIFDKSASNPAAQMQKLLRAFARYLTPFKDLDQFYTVILRNVVPEDCDNDDTVNRYQSVVGAIIFVQCPLSVSTLAHLININVVEIREVLDNLQSVILLGSDNAPRIYHKSFPDYLTDKARCNDPRLQIDTRISHTQIATRCFEIMDKYLKCNILDLGDPARFMSNEDGLKEDGITEEQLQEKIPQQVHYACVHWANHLEIAHFEDPDLTNGMARFVDEHMLHWFEVLSLIGKLDSAHHAIGMVLKLLKSRSSDLHQLLSDALRFIGKFYELINLSALHTYYSGLPFTPSDNLLYRRYIKDAVNSLCSIEGGPEEWDALVANLRHGEQVHVVKVSLDSALFISFSEEDLDLYTQGKLKIWDAATGTPISTITGHRFAVANDFSTVASSEDKTITFYNMNGSARGTMFTTSSKIRKLALSSESSRVAAALADGTVWLWDSGNAELIDSFDGFRGYWPRLEFSATGTRLAHSSANGIKLRDGVNGGFIADLRCGSSHDLRFEFSGDGSRIASLSLDDFDDKLTLWNSESGGLIAAVSSVGQDHLAISTNGSLLATADHDKVTLWSENRDHLAQIKVLKTNWTRSMAFAKSLDDILAIATSYDIQLYNILTHSFIHALPFGGDTAALAFSLDYTRLAVGHGDGNVNLWDIRVIGASAPPSKGNPTAVTELALSRDCSRLACGFRDGTIELWGTSHPTKRRIDPLTLRSKVEAIFFRIFGQSRHARSVLALAFDPNGRLFASGSDDGTIKLWNGGDGALHGTLKTPSRVRAVALSDTVLVATWNDGVALWSLDTLSLIHTFKTSGSVSKVSIAENSALIAVVNRKFFDTFGNVVQSVVSLLDVTKHTTITTFDVPFDTHTMRFLPDNSHLVVQSHGGVCLSFDLINKHITKGLTFEHLVQLPNTPLWHGVPIWYCQNKGLEHYFAALFCQHQDPVPVLWIPREVPVTTWTQASSMIALGCEDGRIILLRLPTSRVS